ncbi:MAG TPA: N-6 DNA methylase, partial [Hanamia sp.]
MSYNKQQKLSDNITAIRIALEWKEGKILSDFEGSMLQRYSGFGGLKAVLFPHGSIAKWQELNASKEDLKLYSQVQELHTLLQQHFTETEYKQVIDSVKNSILTAFYTPEIVPQTLFNVLKEKGIEPENMYEPSSGAGVFVTEAAKVFPELQNITAVEKDILSGRVLSRLAGSIPFPVSVQIKGFENTSNDENGKYDLIVSNIPFGNFPVFDEAFRDESLSGKIHNYFFAKGLDKIKDGGLLAYITTDTFLNNPSNEEARKYLFEHANFISLNVMPDNLMKETGNTEAPSHLLIVQKNNNKESLSETEQLLVNTIEHENEFGKYTVNEFIHHHPEIILGNEIKAGTNQYGKANQGVWLHGDINIIKEKLAATIADGIDECFNKEKFSLQLSENISKGKQLTYLTMPENIADTTSVQLGLFDIAPAENINRAMAYINPLDATAVDKKSARIINTIRTEDKPD